MTVKEINEFTAQHSKMTVDCQSDVYPTDWEGTEVEFRFISSGGPQCTSRFEITNGPDAGKRIEIAFWIEPEHFSKPEARPWFQSELHPLSNVTAAYISGWVKAKSLSNFNRSIRDRYEKLYETARMMRNVDA